jgi:deoxyhypusine synthase
MEANLNGVEALICDVLSTETPPDNTWCSARLCRALGQRLAARNEEPGILRSAYERDVPVFIPALTDSELGLDLSVWAMRRALQAAKREGRTLDLEQLLATTPRFNPFLDLQHYARLVASAPRLGIFTVGGGVPRNWAQQVAPYFDILADRLDVELRIPRFQYGVRICPEPVHWGGLSGCSYSEGISWGKFAPGGEGGRFAEIHADATLAWPLLIKAVLEEL